MALESELHEALTADQLRLFFQMQVDSDQRILGCGGLAALAASASRFDHA